MTTAARRRERPSAAIVLGALSGFLAGMLYVTISVPLVVVAGDAEEALAMRQAELASELTGQAVSVGDLFYAGERILNLERLLNGRFGSTGAEDRLPDMFFDREYNAGQQPSKPQEWMEPMIQEFYTVMGWDKSGRPTEKKLAQLGLIPSRNISDSAA